MRIPEDIEDAVLNLKGLGELITASEWQRAALVWAFTYEAKNQNDAGKDLSQRTSVNEFARTGVMSRPTVTKYRRAWRLAIENGFATDVKPGDLIDLPEVEWQPYFNPDTTSDVEHSNETGLPGIELDIPQDDTYDDLGYDYDETEDDESNYDPIPMDPFVSWMKDLTRVVEKGYRVRMDLAHNGTKSTMRTVITEAMGALQRLLDTEELKETVK